MTRVTERGVSTRCTRAIGVATVERGAGDNGRSWQVGVGALVCYVWPALHGSLDVERGFESGWIRVSGNICDV